MNHNEEKNIESIENIENLNNATGGNTMQPKNRIKPTGPRLKATLFCERCQYTFTVPLTPMKDACPRCGNTDLRPMGIGN